MKRGISGRYEASNVGGEVVRAFIPDPLPPHLPLELTNSRQRLLERATLALGRLDSITLLLPDPNLFLYSYVRREAVLSSQIEGTQSSLSNLLLFELDQAPGVPFDDVVEVSNYVAALEHGVARLHEDFPLSNRLIREMHEKLLSRGRGSEKPPGEFRRSQNWIGGTRPGNAHFVPPPPTHVEDCMAQFERFIHDEDIPYPTLVKAALAHVQFETIHPFLDGNGRIGRLLNLVRSDGDWEAWLEFFLEGVEQTATGAVQTAQHLVKLFKEDAFRIQELGRIAATVLRIFDALLSRPILTLKEVCNRTRISFPAAAKGMNALIKLGIARELTGQQRNRVFAYDRYLAILNEGTEPL
jgi:Fic family protein